MLKYLWNELSGTNTFGFKNTIKKLESYVEKEIPNEHEQKAMICDDIKMWKQQWMKYCDNTTPNERNLAQVRQSVSLGITQQKDQMGVGLLTVHSAKGLEFDVVFIMGMCEGVFPDYRAVRSGGKAIDEEKHNAFVAVTRSKRLLYITYPRMKRMPWGDTKSQKPSRYISMMGVQIQDHD